MSLKGRSVLNAKMHGPFHVPGVGQFGPSLSVLGTTGLNNLTMTVDEGGIVLTTTGKIPGTLKVHEVFIPNGNLEGYELAPLPVRLESVKSK